MRAAVFALIGALILTAAAPAPPPVTLGSDTLGFGVPRGARVTFGLSKAKTLAVAAAALGKPVKTGTYPDCGQGIPIGYAKYRGGLELAFIAGKFVGWTLDEGGSTTMHTERGVGLGTPRATLKKAYPQVSIDPDSSLGVMFSIDDTLGGFLASKTATAKVMSLYAGQVCMVS